MCSSLTGVSMMSSFLPGPSSSSSSAPLTAHTLLLNCEPWDKWVLLSSFFQTPFLWMLVLDGAAQECFFVLFYFCSLFKLFLFIVLVFACFFFIYIYILFFCLILVFDLVFVCFFVSVWCFCFCFLVFFLYIYIGNLLWFLFPVFLFCFLFSFGFVLFWCLILWHHICFDLN